MKLGSEPTSELLESALTGLIRERQQPPWRRLAQAMAAARPIPVKAPVIIRRGYTFVILRFAALPAEYGGFLFFSLLGGGGGAPHPLTAAGPEGGGPETGCEAL